MIIKFDDPPSQEFYKSEDDFGAILNCAIRYSLGRQTYMPKLVIDFIKPMIPALDNRTLYVFIQDIESHIRSGGTLGNPIIDAPEWFDFIQAVKNALEIRKVPYSNL